MTGGPRPFAPNPSALSALTEGFAAPAREQWLAAVRAALKGAAVADLTHHTVEDLAIAPLYGPEPHSARRSPQRSAAPDGAWDVRAVVVHPDPAEANRRILDALAGGAGSILLKIDPSGQAGCAIASGQDLSRALDGVMLEAATAALDAGFLGPEAARWLADAARGSPGAKLALHLDPLTAFAQAGQSPGPIDAHVAHAAEVAAEVGAAHPHAALFLATGAAVHEAGGSAAQELGFMAACAIAYAKALTAAGLPMAQALAGVTFGVCVDGEHLQSIAKLRAARDIWARIAGACGVDAPARIEARSSRRMLTALDPWTNLIRLTAAGFAAGAGGADAVVLAPFTDALDGSSPLADRLARNIQLILIEESHVGAVGDPAAGSWFIEDLTCELAREGWGVFRAIEAQGGAARALEQGFIAGSVEGVRLARAAAVADGSAPILGVTLYPDPDPSPVGLDRTDPAAFAKTGPDLRQHGADSHCQALVPVRTAEVAEQVALDIAP